MFKLLIDIDPLFPAGSSGGSYNYIFSLRFDSGTVIGGTSTLYQQRRPKLRHSCKRHQNVHVRLTSPAQGFAGRRGAVTWPSMAKEGCAKTRSVQN